MARIHHAPIRMYHGLLKREHPFVRQAERLMHEYSRRFERIDEKVDYLMLVVLLTAALIGLSLVWAYLASLQVPPGAWTDEGTAKHATTLDSPLY